MASADRSLDGSLTNGRTEGERAERKAEPYLKCRVRVCLKEKWQVLPDPQGCPGAHHGTAEKEGTEDRQGCGQCLLKQSRHTPPRMKPPNAGKYGSPTATCQLDSSTYLYGWPFNCPTHVYESTRLLLQENSDPHISKRNACQLLGTMENGQSWGTEQGADFDYIKNAIINIKKIEGIAEKIEE